MFVNYSNCLQQHCSCSLDNLSDGNRIESPLQTMILEVEVGITSFKIKCCRRRGRTIVSDRPLHFESHCLGDVSHTKGQAVWTSEKAALRFLITTICIYLISDHHHPAHFWQVTNWSQTDVVQIFQARLLGCACVCAGRGQWRERRGLCIQAP